MNPYLVALAILLACVSGVLALALYGAEDEIQRHAKRLDALTFPDAHKLSDETWSTLAEYIHHKLSKVDES